MQSDHLKRREFITVLGGVAAWPLAARAQQTERVRRIGALMSAAETDPENKARLAAFRQGLEKRGWSEGRNVHIDYRYAPAGARSWSLYNPTRSSQLRRRSPRRYSARAA